MTRSRSKNIFTRKRMFALLGRFSLIKMQICDVQIFSLFIKTFSHWKSAAVMCWTILSCLVAPLRTQKNSLNNTKVPNMDISALLRSFGVRVLDNISPSLFFVLIRLVTTDGWDQCTEALRCLWVSLCMSCLCQKSVRSSWTLHLICTLGTTDTIVLY